MQATYQIVRAESIKKLEKSVNAWIKHGWTPTGGPMRTGSGYAQAIVA